MKKNDILTLDITEINNLGYGVGKIDGMVVFVNGTVDGDRTRVKLIKVNKTYAVGRLEELIAPSPWRTGERFCDAASACGGCVYRHVTYAHEREAKRAYVENAFRKAGLADTRVAPVLCAGREARYRNKAIYPLGETVDRASGERRVFGGFYARKTHDIVKSEDCRLEPEIFSHILAHVCDFGGEHGVSVYDETSRKGLLRHLYLRLGEACGEVMVCVVLNGDAFPHEEAFVSSLCRAFPEITSILVNTNTADTNVVLGNTYRTLWGKPYLEDVLCSLRFEISPESFYQVNHDGAELLYAKAAELAEVDEKTTLIDLYCGIGTIGLSLAARAARVVGVEVVTGAVACARRNAARNGIANAVFHCLDATDTDALARLLADEIAKAEKAVVILDPPRRGVGKETVNFLAGLALSRIVYVSCDPDTLARDAAYFREAGYAVGTVVPVNMFPRTGHCECVVRLDR